MLNGYKSRLVFLRLKRKNAKSSNKKEKYMESFDGKNDKIYF